MDYQLGPQKNYVLKSAALQHILHGDLTKRNERLDGKTMLTTILTGGLHTFEAWEAFLAVRPDIKHGLFFNENAGEDWYFIRETNNGVMLLKMPRSAFQNNAAKMTKMAENYYNSGYLWKTLFPKGYDEVAIVKAIDEALTNQDIEETTADHITGYTKNEDPFKVLKVRIQLKGHEIHSAYPTWGQPMTGNEGKPYSPSEGLRIVVAASTLFTEFDLIRSNNLFASFNKTAFQELMDKTPHFILARKRSEMGKDRVRQRQIRQKELGQIASKLTTEAVAQIYKLAMSDIYIRYPFAFLRSMYDEYYLEITQSLRTKNAGMLYQNFHELLTVLACRDKADKSKRAFEIIKRYLKVHFIFTGGIDQWEAKRISSLMMDIIIEYNDEKISREFVALLNTSPARIAIFTDFNTYTLLSPKPEITGLTGIPEPLYLNHFYEYVVQQLGINYTWNFDATFNRQKAIEAQQYARYGIELAKDQVTYSLASDFHFFSEQFGKLCGTMKINGDSVKLIEEILLTYKRCMAVNLQRIMVMHRELLRKHEEEYEFDTPEHIRFTHAKHEHQFIRQLYEMMLQEIAELFKTAGFHEEGDKLAEKYGKIVKEAGKIPIPKSVPSGLKGSATPDDFEDEDPPGAGIERPYKVKKDTFNSFPPVNDHSEIVIVPSLHNIKLY
jgi:hypothetical protein